MISRTKLFGKHQQTSDTILKRSRIHIQIRQHKLSQTHRQHVFYYNKLIQNTCCLQTNIKNTLNDNDRNHTMSKIHINIVQTQKQTETYTHT